MKLLLYLYAGATCWLTAAECEAVIAEAKARLQASKDRLGRYQNWSADKLDALAHECNSVGAELAFANLARGVWAYALDGHSVEGRPDVYLQDGRSVDVKQTPQENGRLLRWVEASGRADLYALMTGVMPIYTFRGWVTADELVKPWNVSHAYGRAPAYALGRLAYHPCLELEVSA